MLMSNNMGEGKHNKTSSYWASFSMGNLFGLMAIMCLLYYILLDMPHYFFSLSFLIHFILNLPVSEQLIAMVLLPIYLAVVIFGGAMFGIWFGGFTTKQLKILFSSK